jgi:hypothetical protein
VKLKTDFLKLLSGRLQSKHALTEVLSHGSVWLVDSLVIQSLASVTPSLPVLTVFRTVTKKARIVVVAVQTNVLLLILARALTAEHTELVQLVSVLAELDTRVCAVRKPQTIVQEFLVKMEDNVYN